MKKAYLVTGASSDIGMSLVRKLAEREKESVFFCHYRRDNEKFSALRTDFLSIRPIQADFANSQEILRLIDNIKETGVSPTHIVHLPAERIEYVRLKDIEKHSAQREMEIGVYSLLEIFKAFLPQMAKNRYGKIAVMLTTCTRGAPPKFLTGYCMAKYALLGLMKSAAAEYEGKGVYINGISPEMTDTKFLSNLDSRIIETSLRNSRFGRNLTVDEVVNGILFLISDDINCMNGENLFLG
ncbi:MAG: SDR family oxidoreductase [Synergistaceae bacterium]|jgi:3-oxoacyl-[acyl-carrier protein] reductase|nr:SDR family oxidoreductase [Synergistaceae bacterium]